MYLARVSQCWNTYSNTQMVASYHVPCKTQCWNTHSNTLWNNTWYIVPRKSQCWNIYSNTLWNSIMYLTKVSVEIPTLPHCGTTHDIIMYLARVRVVGISCYNSNTIIAASRQVFCFWYETRKTESRLYLCVSSYKCIRQRNANIKIDCFENGHLHVDQFISSVCIVTDVLEVINNWRTLFLKQRNTQTSNSKSQ